MEFSCERLGLSRILSRAASVASVKTATTALQCVLLEAKDGRLTARATDLFSGVEASTDADVKAPGTICVDARRASEIANKLAPGPVRMRTAKNQLEISSGKAKFKLGTFPASEYPDLPRVDATTPRLGRFEARDLTRVLSQGSYAMHTSVDEGSLNATLIDSLPGKLRVYSTDRNRLAYAELNVDVPKARLLLPHKAASSLMKLCGDHKEGQVEIAHHMGYLLISSGDVILSTKLADEDKFPPAQLVFDRYAAEITHRVRVGRDEFVEAIERVAIVSSSEKDRPDVFLELSPGKIRITATSKSSDEAEDEVECDAACEMRLEVNPQYMIAAMKAAPEDEIELGLKDSESAIFVRGVDATEHVAIVMPIKQRDA
jgi:DNA polymerase-3 subunit beta